MEYDEFIKLYVEREKKLQTVFNWNSYILEEINKGTLNVPDDNFNQKLKEYKNTTDVSERYKLLTEMKEIYINFLKNNAEIKSN